MNHIEEYHDPELKQMRLEKKKKPPVTKCLSEVTSNRAPKF